MCTLKEELFFFAELSFYDLIERSTEILLIMNTHLGVTLCDG